MGKKDANEQQICQRRASGSYDDGSNKNVDVPAACERSDKLCSCEWFVAAMGVDEGTGEGGDDEKD